MIPAARGHNTLALARLLNIQDYVHTSGTLSSLTWRLQENDLVTPTLAELDSIIKNTPDESTLPYRDDLGRPPLMICANIGRVDLGKRLIDANIWSLDAQENNGWTALHCACFSHATEFAQMLLKMGANPAARRNGGITPYLDAVLTEAESVQSLLQADRVRWEDVPEFPAGSSVSTDDLRKFIKLTGVAGSELMSDHATDGSKLPHRSDKLQLYDLLHTVHDDEAVPIKGRASQLEGLLAALVHQLSVEKTPEFKPLMMYLLQSNLLQALDFDLGSTGKAFEGFVDMASKGIECLQIVLDTTFSSMKVLPTLKYRSRNQLPEWTCGHKVGARSESPRRDSTGKWHGSKKVITRLRLLSYRKLELARHWLTSSL